MAKNLKHENVLYFDDAITQELHDRAIGFLESLPQSALHKISNQSAEASRVGYGGIDRKMKKEGAIPKELEDLLPCILKSIHSLNPEESRLLDFFRKKYRITVNKYKKKRGLGFHKDWKADNDAMVIGLTLGTHPDTKRSMMFKQDKNTYRVLTYPKSVYMFYGDAYHNCKHGSKASDKQVGVVYSITFRSTC